MHSSARPTRIAAKGRTLALLASIIAATVSIQATAGSTSDLAAGKLPTSSAAQPAKAAPAKARLGLDIPDVRSKSVLVYDESKASVLYSRHADEPLPIASITKLMTALVVLEANLPLDEKIQITAADRDDEKGSYSRLAIGAKLTRADLLHLSLMSSENRAAHALGRTYPGGLEAFVTAMNVKAQALGMTRTKFVEPTGLSSRNVASPADLAKLVAATSEQPLIREYSTSPEHVVTVGAQTLTYRNTNALVKNPAWDVVVQKTGFINEAGQCLVMQAVIDGRNVVFVLLDSFGKLTRLADAKRIRTWMEARQLAAAR